MTQAGYRHRIIIQDRSGSMGDDDDFLAGAQRGLEEFLRGAAKAPGRVTVSLWDFDTEIRCVHSFVPPEHAAYRIQPRGGTNLYGAVGQAVTTEGEALAALPEGERPEDVTVLVASDGKHNTTMDWTGARVKALLERQQGEYSWRVLYMGCGTEAFNEGERIGTHGGLTVNTAHSGAGQQAAWKMSGNYLDRVPVASAATMDSYVLSDEERALGESGKPGGK
jgi:hypothetical protein